MSIKTTYAPGPFNWVDLMTKDAKAAAAFYCGLFGWTAKPQSSDGGSPYTMFLLDGQVVAGMGEMSDGMKKGGVKPAWNSYVSVGDAAAIAAKVTALGGKVTMPLTKLLDAGSMAFCADPEGSPFAIWQPDQHIGASLVNDPGAFCWNELACRKDETLTFYEDLFGWTFNKNVGPKKYTNIINDGSPNGGVMKMTEAWGDMPSHWMVYFSVADCQASCLRIKELGGGVCVPPTEIPPGTFAVVNDPQGATFTILEMKRPLGSSGD